MLKRICCMVLVLLSMPAAAAGDIPSALAAYRGRVVYVDFWASWCTPCAASFPWLNSLQQKFGPQLAVVGINVDESDAAATAFLKHHPAYFDIVRDPAGALAEHYRVAGMPSSVILDGEGRVLHQHVGFRPQDTGEYEAAIRAALSASTRNPSGDHK